MPYSASQVRSRDRMLRVLLVGPPKSGKAQPIDEPVLTPSGWRAIGDLKIGDAVIGSNGKACRVTGVFPQGRLEVLRVTMDDGTWARCSRDHLWFTTTKNELHRGRWKSRKSEGLIVFTGAWGSGSPKETEAIDGSLANETHYVPRVEPVTFDSPSSSLPLDPYYLGLLLGDGSLTSSTPNFTSLDEELIEAVQRAAAALGDRGSRSKYANRCDVVRVMTDKHGPSRTTQILRSMDLIGKRSEHKHVPDVYLRASIEDRLELLRGLLDTDGHCNSTGSSAEYATVSPHLRDAVIEIARSLGGRVSWRLKPTTCLPAYSLRISFPESGLCPFKLSRKATAWRKPSRQQRQFIESISPSGSAECVCISVDAPDQLYVTRNYLLTHNTVASVKTVPGPVFVMNTDGQGGLDPVASMGGEFVAEDVTGLSSFEKALLYFKQHISEFESLVLDNITSLSQTFERETREQAPGNSDGRTIYPEYTRRLVKAFDQLLALPRHLIILGHTEEPQGDQGPGNFGHVLGISGRARTIIPMKMQDWICMHAESKPGGGCIYQFLLAPTGNWNKGVRSIQGAKRMPADFCKFIDIMSNGGIAPKALEEQGTAFEPVSSKKPAPAQKPANGQQVRR